MSDQPLSARQLGKRIGVAHTTILAWYDAGIIDAEIAESRTIRFNEQDVRRKLKNRAKKAQQARIDKTNLPDGMVPTC